MFGDVDIGECLKSSVIITGYLVASVGIIFVLTYEGYIETSIFENLDVTSAVLGVAVVFNLIFAFMIIDQGQ